MKPVVQRRVEVFSEGCNLLRELALESGEYVVELESVGVQVDPSRVSSEDGKSLSAPETVRRTPVSDFRKILSHVLV